MAEAQEEQKAARKLFDESLKAIDDANAELLTTAENIATEQKIQADLEAQRDEATAASKRAAVEMYINPATDLLGVVLASPTVEEAIYRAEQVRQVLGAQRHAVTRFSTEVEKSQTKVEEYNAAIVKLNKDKSDAEGATILAMAAFQTAQLKEGAALIGIKLFGRVVFPIDGPHTFRNDWGEPRMPGTAQAHTHQGTDIFAPYGTRLVAIEGGWTRQLSVDDLGGTGFFLEGDSGTWYYYAHLSAYAPGISEGKRVEAGDLVGFVGDTGNAQGGTPHLHFQVHPDHGAPVNPFPLLDLIDRITPVSLTTTTLDTTSTTRSTQFYDPNTFTHSFVD